MDLNELFAYIFDLFLDPKKRIYFGYLGSAIVIAFAWLVFSKGMSLKQAFLKVFDAKIFFSRSSKIDAKVYMINRVFTFFVSPLLITQLVVATFIFNQLLTVEWLTPAATTSLHASVIVFSFTLCVFLLDDFTKYIVHRWMHRFPILWALHKVHHTAEQLTPMTIFRTHPIEGIVFSLRSAFTQGVLISTFFYFFGSSVSLMTVLGANIIVFAFNVCGSNLRHSHIGIRYWQWLEYILISPAQHQLHHSVAEEHFDKNFGATLALWDWIFGSLHHSVDTDSLVLGVKDQYEDRYQSLFGVYLLPILEMGFAFKKLSMKLVQRLFSFNERLHVQKKKIF